MSGAKVTASPTEASEQVPEEWARLGFSGMFHIEATLSNGDKPMTPAEVDTFEARLPDRVPFGTNSGWLALRVNRDADPPAVVLVRDDAAAIIDFTRRTP